MTFQNHPGLPPDGPAPGRGLRRWALLALAAIAAVAAGGIGGYVLGFKNADDADQVRSLQAKVSTTESAVNELRDASSTLSDRVNDLQGENDTLQDRLKAEQNLKGEGGSVKPSNADAPTGELSIGQAATVGDYTLKPTSVESIGAGRFRATIVVKNDGTESDSPLCGGGAQLLDEQGRSFDGDAVIDESSAACDDLQPGLSGTIQIDFKTPPDAKPVVLELTPDALNDGDTKSWNV